MCLRKFIALKVNIQMNFSGALMEGICLSYDIVKCSEGKIFSNNRIDSKVILHKLDYISLANFVIVFLRKVTENENLILKIKKYKFPNDSVYGTCTYKKKTHEINIYVNSELNECWTRFAICKELIQLYLDCSETTGSYKSYSPYEIIEQIKVATINQQYLSSANKDYEFDEGFNSEALAYIVSTDLFFPKKNKLLIKEIGTIIIEGLNTNFTHFDLANLFKTPEYITKFYRFHIEEASLIYLKTGTTSN